MKPPWIRTIRFRAMSSQWNYSVGEYGLRGWVTIRKDYSIVDIAAAGGWGEVRTVENSYMKADSATKQRVVLME